MRRHRALAWLVAVAVLLPQFPAVAAAAGTGPATGPAVIRSEGFETLPYAADLTIEPALIPGNPAVSAFWGRITQRAHTGSYGLWSAGSVPASPTAVPWVAFGGKYPDFTQGVATFDLGQLADYYSASLAYWYLMPSLGSSDAESFHVMWGADGSSWDAHPSQPLAATWTQQSWDLTAPSNYRNLSRTAGIVRFGFIDNFGDFSESPTNGEGPTIDDVVVSGYKFGPVRDLAASVVAGKAHLTWNTPWRSTAAAAAEERTVAYRVWRASDAAPDAWTELTSSRQTSKTFDDTASLNGVYRYAVQAWDTGTGTGYGGYVSATLTLSASVPAPAAPSGISADPSTPSPAILVTWTDNAVNEDYYVVERSENGGAFSPVATPAADSISFKDTLDGIPAERQSGSTWTYRVKAVNGGGSSAWATSSGLKLGNLLPVYRFYNFKKGVHFYTADLGEKNNVIAKLSSTYRYETVAYSVNTANPANATPLWRFYNFKKGVHFYTADLGEKNNVVAKLSTTYRLEGVAYDVCATNVAGSTPVWRFYNFKKGVHFYTADLGEKNNVVAKLSTTYRLEGVAFYLAP